MKKYSYLSKSCKRKNIYSNKSKRNKCLRKKTVKRKCIKCMRGG